MDETEALQRLARLHGVETAYTDIAGRLVTPPPESILAVLRGLGAPVETVADLPEALAERSRELWRRGLPPVIVAWDGRAAGATIRLPRSREGDPILLRIETEQGERREERVLLTGAPARAGRVDGEEYVEKPLSVPGGVPPGYHGLTVEWGSTVERALIISAPAMACAPPGGAGKRRWGVFIPLYALRSRRSAGSGDLADLDALLAWTAALGGEVVGTLPLLAAFLSEPYEPSPYSPASRLFWNEFFVDLSGLPGLSECPEAAALLGSAEFEREARTLRESPFVDYRGVMAIKRRVLDAAARRLLGGAAELPARFREFLAANPAASDYAAFRAAADRRRAPWRSWPAPLRDGVLRDGDYDVQDRRYHLYAQWAMEEQLGGIGERARARGQSLYLDLPLGVSADSYDVWRHRDRFVAGVSAGAPPDEFFTRGQDWGFPPLHPERIREDGHAYYRDCLRRQLRHAGVLRIDHVMGFHRFFWVPKGMEARDGTYVRYPAEEFYALLSLESHRHRARVVGEDLGTVPPEVRGAMDRHGIARMFVLQFSLSPDPAAALPAVPEGALACVNTHDMPPFAAFWSGRDIADRAALGHLDGEGRRSEEGRRRALKEALVAFLRRERRLRGRVENPVSILSACLSHLAAGGAGIVVANLEDLWLEQNPQNIPGTWTERPNWMRKARYPLEELREVRQLAAILAEMDRARRQSG